MHVTLAYLGRENLELEVLSAVLKSAGHRVGFAYDPGAFSANDNVLRSPRLERRYSRMDALAGMLAAEPPDVLFAWTSRLTYDWATRLSSSARARVRSAIVFGGRHPTFAPHAVMRRSEVDYVVAGEAEQSLPELLEALAGARSIESVPGVYRRQDGRVVFNGPRAPIADLDSLPWPDKDLFAEELNLADDYLIACGRGCPGMCSYCEEALLMRTLGPGYYRQRGVDSILDELEAGRGRFGYKSVMIQDPILFGSRAWVLEFLQKYRDRIRAPFRCYGQAAFLDEQIVLALKQAGCYCVEFGYQTANDRIRREICNRPETNEQAKRAFAICDRHDLRYDIDQIIGLPGESEQDFVDAARIYAEARCLNRIKVHMLVYHPGAPILQDAMDMGLADEQDMQEAESAGGGDIARTGSVRRAETDRFARDWNHFFKIMPLFGRRLALAMVDHRWNRLFGSLPGPLIIALQILEAIRGRDRRFWIYFKYLLFRLKRHRRFLREAEGRGWL